jgi:hypothetical protein
LDLLVLAADGHEAQLAQELEQLIELGQLPDLNALTQLLAPPKGDVPQVGRSKEHELRYFLQLAGDQCKETLDELKGPLKFMGDVDSLYMDFIPDAAGIKPATASILLLNAHASLRAAMHLALSGQLVPVFMTMRGSIESALYANSMVANPALEDVWLNRDRDKRARQTCRQEFTSGKMFDYLSNAQDREFSDRIREIYDSTIDFGAHPNSRSLISSTRIEKLTTGEHALNFAYIHGIRSFELKQALVACAEIGLQVFFIALICFEKHPRLKAMNHRALELQDQVPEFIEQLGLGSGEMPE